MESSDIFNEDRDCVYFYFSVHRIDADDNVEIENNRNTPLSCYDLLHQGSLKAISVNLCTIIDIVRVNMCSKVQTSEVKNKRNYRQPKLGLGLFALWGELNVFCKIDSRFVFHNLF